MKIFSLFLPQFYETDENNEWWGKGFTEWTNVKAAKSLLKGHIQPKHPLGNNYYNMMDKSTMLWQTTLMKEYGLSGMIYYHYYFNGRLLLEKPAENLLKWQDVNQPFFFCWANHTWYRSWEGSKHVLIEQTYGDVDDWKRHFDYVLPFFKDVRYEKEENRPLFMIYDAFTESKTIDAMVVCFDQWCKEAGFAGLKCIKEIFHFPNSDELKSCRRGDSIYVTEPLCGRAAYENRTKFTRFWNALAYTLSDKGYRNKPLLRHGNDIYHTMINRSKNQKKDVVIPGIYFEWDNTPRHGNRGFIIDRVEKRLFMEYMDTIKGSDYAIINAWNEWAEGMIMEPTIEEGYQNLEWIKEWLDSQKEV